MIKKQHSLLTTILRHFRSNRLACISFWIVIVFVGLSLYGEAVHWYYQWKDTTPSYNQPKLEEQYLPPSFLRNPFKSVQHDNFFIKIVSGIKNLTVHPLGTDNLGRDILQRIIQGSRIAFQVGIITSLIAIPIGAILGCLAGYFGGRTDDIIVWLYSTVASMPGLLFILAIAMVVGKGLQGIYLGIGLTTWVGLCRLIRGEVIKHKNRPYVTAARALGLGNFRIIFRHILPNIFHIVIITFSLRFPAAISTEVVMSFLGIGVQGDPSWGIMIGNARLRLWQGIWWEMTFVTIAITLVVLAFNLLGDTLRDALDPRLRTTET
jgi:ABC-type dipeptide/oligopeptide/nickel transport system permease subunit